MQSPSEWDFKKKKKKKRKKMKSSKEQLYASNPMKTDWTTAEKLFKV